ncbi:hypothetical protein SPLC1_S521190 [Arthrospira platensis C1]|nr:hypothetical protein SPLC1_S521190 [Arthrospira platensis C1]
MGRIPQIRLGVFPLLKGVRSRNDISIALSKQEIQNRE